MPNTNFQKNKERLQKRASNSAKEKIPVLENYLNTANRHLNKAKNSWTYGGMFTGKRNAHLDMAKAAVRSGLAVANSKNKGK